MQPVFSAASPSDCQEINLHFMETGDSFKQGQSENMVSSKHETLYNNQGQ